MGVDEDNGRYIPTAKASEGTPLNSRTIYIITPSRTNPHGNSPLRMPLMM